MYTTPHLPYPQGAAGGGREVSSNRKRREGKRRESPPPRQSSTLTGTLHHLLALAGQSHARAREEEEKLTFCCFAGSGPAFLATFSAISNCAKPFCDHHRGACSPFCRSRPCPTVVGARCRPKTATNHHPERKTAAPDRHQSLRRASPCDDRPCRHVQGLPLITVDETRPSTAAGDVTICQKVASKSRRYTPPPPLSSFSGRSVLPPTPGLPSSYLPHRDPSI